MTGKVENGIDDGSLSFLGIGPNPDGNRFYHCKRVKQSQLTDKTFWVHGYSDVTETKYGPGRVVVLVGREHNSPEEQCAKFFSNSSGVKYILRKIKELNAFPRKVTLKKDDYGQFYMI